MHLIGSRQLESSYLIGRIRNVNVCDVHNVLPSDHIVSSIPGKHVFGRRGKYINDPCVLKEVAIIDAFLHENFPHVKLGPEHEPFLPLGVVTLWQVKSGTQCGAFGWWTGPFSHQCDGKLLHNITNHSVVEQHHQLAYVSHLPANTKSHAQINFFLQKNTTKHMTFSKQLTGWHQVVHDANTNPANASYYVLEEESAQIPLWDVMICGTVIHSIPRGNVMHKGTSQGRRGRTKSIPRRTGHLRREVTSETTHVGVKNLCRELCPHGEHMCECFVVLGAQNFYSARGTELLWC